jgi:hypothetical protein
MHNHPPDSTCNLPCTVQCSVSNNSLNYLAHDEKLQKFAFGRIILEDRHPAKLSFAEEAVAIKVEACEQALHLVDGGAQHTQQVWVPESCDLQALDTLTASLLSIVCHLRCC